MPVQLGWEALHVALQVWVMCVEEKQVFQIHAAGKLGRSDTKPLHELSTTYNHMTDLPHVTGSLMGGLYPTSDGINGKTETLFVFEVIFSLIAALLVQMLVVGNGVLRSESSPAACGSHSTSGRPFLRAGADQPSKRFAHRGYLTGFVLP